MRFQFLIGRLDTADPCAVYWHTVGFQFLIGRLDTFLLALDILPQQPVSIPHR